MLGHKVTRDAVEAQPMRHVRWLAIESDSTVLLKGPTTLIAGPSGPIFSQADGVSWMATAGSGDVLAGIAGALMASGIDAPHAGAMAAFVHGKAGALGSNGGPLAAMEMADATPAVVADLLNDLQEQDPGRRR
jgi:NAD(P)H-hydrate repair Nnr-like enzyme with NAD(P)H-hydrate dehydratase domain